MEAITIPPMTHELSGSWEQPPLSEIDTSSGVVASMNRQTFERLACYNESVPSAIYEGKMWRRLCYGGGGHPRGWYLLWFDAHPYEMGHCRLRSLPIHLIP